MFLSKIQLNSQSREARRDLSNPYEMHSTLCRAFSSPDQKCPAGEFLWRLESGEGAFGTASHVLIQSRSLPEWSRIMDEWFAYPPASAINLEERLHLGSLAQGRRFRYRVRANPCKADKAGERDTRGKRRGLFVLKEQLDWLERSGLDRYGFDLPSFSFDPEHDHAPMIDVKVSEERVLKGYQRAGGRVVSVFSVLYDGYLTVRDPDQFRLALKQGIGHGKTMGLGLLSVAPVP